MFYNIAAAQDKFEVLVLLVLLLNIFVFVTITFMPQFYRNVANWATRLIDRLFNGLFTTRHHEGG